MCSSRSVFCFVLVAQFPPLLLVNGPPRMAEITRIGPLAAARLQMVDIVAGTTEPGRDIRDPVRGEPPGPRPGGG